MEFAHIEGHGLNAEELGRNPQMDHYFVQDLNENPQLPLTIKILTRFSTPYPFNICNIQRLYLPRFTGFSNQVV
jgi:hypothetical protein